MNKFFSFFRRYLIAGLIFWLPLLVTFIILRFIISMMDNAVALLPHQYQPEQLFDLHIPGLGVVFALIIVFTTGLLLTNFLGQNLIKLWDIMLSRIPFVRSIYSAVKQMMDALLSTGGNSFKKVLLIEFPRPGMWSFAFQTHERPSLPVKEELIAVFIPTTPNPTAGFLVMLPKKEVIELDMSVEEALKTIVSLGVIQSSPKIKDKN